MADGVTLPKGRAALEAPFDAFVLLSEPLEFATAEIVEALHADHPFTADWAADPRAPAEHDTATRGGCDARFLDRRSGACMRIASVPGRLPAEFEAAMARETDRAEARWAIADHRGHLFLSAQSARTDYLHRYVAARALTALLAVFARLPICLGVNFFNANRIAPPAEWLDIADLAASDMVCHTHWYAQNTVLGPDDGHGPTEAEWRSWGLSAFLGYELMLRGRLPDPRAATMMMYGVLERLLRELRPLRDGERVVFAGGGEAVARFVPAGRYADIDVWLLLMPTSAIDEERALGPRPSLSPEPEHAAPEWRWRALAKALDREGIR